MKDNIKGLTDEEVLERVNKGLKNYEVKVKSKSIKKILKDNCITVFNILNVCLSLSVFLVGSIKNGLFIGFVFVNTIIGIVEEIKAKITLEKIKILVKNTAIVIRNGKEQEVDANDIVLDDVIKYTSGVQVLVDSKCLDNNLLVNESLVTGESEPITKRKGDILLSGSFIVSGVGYAKVVNVGKDNYTSKIYNTASTIDNNNSIIVDSIKKFIKFISIIIIPIGLILFHSQYQIDHDLQSSVVNTTAALVSMIPDGLVLLSSTVFVISALKLARKHVLVQELNCIDSLAAIDVFCFDKTGTLTNNNMKLERVIALDKKYNLDEILANYAYSSNDNNATMDCLKEYYKNYNCRFKKDDELLFNSINKYSAISFKNNKKYFMGAKEVLKDIDTRKYDDLYRIVAVYEYEDDIRKLNKDKLKPIGLVLLNDTLKENAKEIIRHITESNLDIKLISGDSMPFLKSIAKRLELDRIDCIDLSNEENIDYDLIVDKYNIFARVTPEEKLEIIKALKRKKHRVAMVGDGVNDILALKEADASISFKSAKNAARNASKVILLNDDFENVIHVINEGRKSMNNMCRSASLFINKTIYSTLLALLFVFIKTPYPFKPIQFTLSNFILIGTPSFLLAFIPNNFKPKKNFIKEILVNSIPTALVFFLNIVVVVITSQFYDISEHMSTMCFYLLSFNGFLLIFKICRPFNVYTTSLFVFLLALFFLSVNYANNIFDIPFIPTRHFLFVIIICLIDICLVHIINSFLQNNIKQ